MTAPLGQIGIVGALDPAADVGCAIDAFAEVLRVDVVALRFLVRAAGMQAINAIERRKKDRQRAREGRNVFLKHLPRALHELQVIQRADLARVAVAKDGDANSTLDEPNAAIERCVVELRRLSAKFDFVRLTGGGGTDFDQLFIALVERLEPIWEKGTGSRVPRSAIGPFVTFVVSCWIDLGWPDEFLDKNREPMALVDAVGSRLISRQKNLTQNR
jgi:hypothetical protein